MLSGMCAVSSLLLLLDVDVLTSSRFKKKMVYFLVPSEQALRTDILLELIDAKLCNWEQSAATPAPVLS